MRDLNRLDDLLQGYEFMKKINDNWVIIENGLNLSDYEIEHLRKRITNLVIASGGNSSNEVVDLRVSKIQNKIFELAKDRLDSDLDSLADSLRNVMTRITSIELTNEQVLYMLNRLYGLDAGSIEVYVDSVSGDDTNGTGEKNKPFKTINKATMNFPRVFNSNTLRLWINPGRYDEDVIIPPLSGVTLYILSSNYETVDPVTGPTACQVRSISVSDTSGYIYIAGIEQTNTAGTTKNYFIKATRCGFVRITKCRMAFNTKAIDPFTAVFIDACSADVNGCYFASQNVDVRGYNTARVEVQNTTHGAKSAIGLYPQSADIFNLNSGTWEADIPTRLSGGGVVRT
ncbi:hypothetical protein MWH39_001640 [Listeria monocytogenes]|nr:hypothetical protein [Listeria monocytogenes]EJA3787667.1 hypothetical protein [Listeria monocytogenes]